MIAQWEEQEEMKKKQELKKGSFPTEMNLGNGIRKIKDQNFGICLMEKRKWENILEYSQFLIGQKWMFGNIYYMKNLNYLPYIFLIKEK